MVNDVSILAYLFYGASCLISECAFSIMDVNRDCNTGIPETGIPEYRPIFQYRNTGIETVQKVAHKSD